MITCGVLDPSRCQGEPVAIILVGRRQYRSAVIAWTAFLRCASHSADRYVPAIHSAFPELIVIIVPIVYGKLKIITPAERTSNEASNPHHSHVPRADR